MTKVDRQFYDIPLMGYALYQAITVPLGGTDQKIVLRRSTEFLRSEDRILYEAIIGIHRLAASNERRTAKIVVSRRVCGDQTA